MTSTSNTSYFDAFVSVVLADVTTRVSPSHPGRVALTRVDRVRLTQSSGRFGLTHLSGTVRSDLFYGPGSICSWAGYVQF